MLTLAKSEDPYKMPHNVAFNQGLHCLLRQKWSLEKEIQYNLEITIYDPMIYAVDHPKFSGGSRGGSGGSLEPPSLPLFFKIYPQ